jgi:hypothetical protein
MFVGATGNAQRIGHYADKALDGRLRKSPSTQLPEHKMKKIFVAALAALSTLALGATLNPIQLLNPAGSTAGQVIASTGTATPPAWTTVTLSGLGGTVAVANGGTGATTQSAALTNLLGSSVVPVTNGGTGTTSAAAELARIGAASTSGTLAQFASTTSAQLAGVISDKTGTGSNVFGVSPTLTTPNIVGTTAGSNAAAGSVGEYLTGSASAVSLTNGSWTNCGSIPLAAGDYDVQGNVKFIAAGTTQATAFFVGISTTSATAGTDDTFASRAGFTNNAGFGDRMISPTVRVNLSSAGTAYLICQAGFTTSTMTANGVIRARRIR